MSGTMKLHIESLPFTKIPGPSKLFLDYLSHKPSLKKYYPNAVSDIAKLKDRAPEVLDRYSTDRDSVCDVLASQNANFGANASAMQNIDLLRGNDSVAVLTGQQVGLFSGPLYTIYKALSAIKGSEFLNKNGVKAVPIFWAATEDHDLVEVSTAYTLESSGSITAAQLGSRPEDTGKPVGDIAFDNTIDGLVDSLFAGMSRTEFSTGVKDLLHSCYRDGTTYGSAFASLLSKLFDGYGLIVFDPSDPGAKKLASPIYAIAVERSADIGKSLFDRSNELVSDGYHAQVLIGKDHFPLFWQSDEGVRRSIKRVDELTFKISGEGTTLSIDEMLGRIETQPERFSPGVMLRPVVQDFLFPTICYFGGGAEIAYFAQISEVYRILERPVTTILPRQSFTVVEAKHARAMKKYGFAFVDLFVGTENLWPELVERMIDPETPRVFSDVSENINTEVNRLDQQLSKIDPTLAEALAKRRRKIIYHIDALRRKFERVSIEKDETIKRQITSMHNSLLPNGGLQERTLNLSVFANLYGPQVLDWLHDAIDLNDDDHKLVYL